MKNLMLSFLLLFSAMLFAADRTYHQDHRSSLVKLDYIPAQASKALQGDGAALANHFLRANASVYGIDPSLQGLDLTEVKQSLVGTHYHYAQSLHGIPVDAAEIIVSINYDGEVYMVYNNTYPITAAMKASVEIRIDEENALDIAWDHLRVHGPLMAAPQAELVYMPAEDGFRLVQKVDIAVDQPFGYWQHIIDARDGEILDFRTTTISRNPEADPDFEAYSGEVWDRHATMDLYERALAERDGNQAVAKAAANGSGQVFDPDPVTTLQTVLQDTSSASSFNGAYVNRTLQDIDLSGGTYRLNGPWVNIADFDSPTQAPTTTSNGNWNYTRGNQGFNDAMTYFHVDQSQRYMQSLGFTGSTGIQYNSITVDADGANGADNSYFQPGNNRMSFGHGCVDDNEDAFVILHEYGHAIHHSINSNWSGGDTGGMGEGFGDYWGGSYRYRNGGQAFNPAWAFPWDGHNNCWGGRTMDKTNYQYDPTKSYPAHATVGGVYSDELWSTPLFQALVTLLSQGVAHSEVDQIVLQAHFGLGSGLSMRDMATAIVNTANTLFPSGNHDDVFRQKFEDQNILTSGGGGGGGGTVLSNGQTVSGLSASSGEWLHYTIEIPSGASNFSASISGGSGDADLYTRAGAQPTTGSYDCRPYQGGNNETCTAASPAAGTMHVSIRAYSSFANVSLTVSFDEGGGGGGCTPANNNQSNLSGSSGSWKHYTIDVPSCATQLNVVMSGGSGDADLYRRFGAQPTTSTYDCRPYRSGNSEDCSVSNPQAGTHHVSVRAYSAYSGVNLTISYE